MGEIQQGATPSNMVEGIPLAESQMDGLRRLVFFCGLGGFTPSRGVALEDAEV